MATDRQTDGGDGITGNKGQEEKKERKRKRKIADKFKSGHLTWSDGGSER